MSMVSVVKSILGVRWQVCVYVCVGGYSVLVCVDAVMTRHGYNMTKKSSIRIVQPSRSYTSCAMIVGRISPSAQAL
jgi:hypothetical protein